MKIIPGNARHIGTRPEQQDAFGFSDIDDHDFTVHGGVAAVVADGMGGHSMGRDAGLLAVQTFLQVYMAKPPEEEIEAALIRSLYLANDAVHGMAVEHQVEHDCGTTLVAAVMADQALYFVSVGDSRLYLLHQGELTCLSRDHVYAGELDRLVEQGEIQKETADTHPNRNALTSFLGMAELLEVDSGTLPIQPEDRLLLCTDGLYGSLDKATMIDALSEADPQAAAERLIQSALDQPKKHQDNLTAAILARGEPGSKSRPEQKGAIPPWKRLFYMLRRISGWN